MISTVACVNVQTASDVSDEDDKSENAEEGGSMGQALGIAGEVEVADAPTSPPLAGVGDVAAPAAPRVSDALTGMLVVAVPAGPLLVPFAWREFGVHATATAEPLLYDASCALRDGMLLSQGRLFVFKRRVAFYSCIFGFVRRKILVRPLSLRSLVLLSSDLSRPALCAGHPRAPPQPGQSWRVRRAGGVLRRGASGFCFVMGPGRRVGRHHAPLARIPGK
jgi:hypothetical protein